jgi:hypothetical protein
MPCRDDYDACEQILRVENNKAQQKRLQKRNDELAAENCQLRGLLCHLYETTDMTTLWDILPVPQATTFRKALKDQKIHRKKDKNREIKAKTKELKEFQKRQNTILELGGVPGKELLDEIQARKTSLAEIKKSDPMSTELY